MAFPEIAESRVLLPQPWITAPWGDRERVAKAGFGLHLRVGPGTSQHTRNSGSSPDAVFRHQLERTTLLQSPFWRTAENTTARNRGPCTSAHGTVDKGLHGCGRFRRIDQVCAFPRWTVAPFTLRDGPGRYWVVLVRPRVWVYRRRWRKRRPQSRNTAGHRPAFLARWSAGPQGIHNCCRTWA